MWKQQISEEESEIAHTGLDDNPQIQPHALTSPKNKLLTAHGHEKHTHDQQ